MWSSILGLTASSISHCLYLLGPGPTAFGSPEREEEKIFKIIILIIFYDKTVLIIFNCWQGLKRHLLAGRVLNPQTPNIHIQILQTDLHSFPLRISWENLIKHQGIFSFVIIFYILTTLSLDNVWTLLGENCCRSLFGLKGLKKKNKSKFEGKFHIIVQKSWKTFFLGD